MGVDLKVPSRNLFGVPVGLLDKTSENSLLLGNG